MTDSQKTQPKLPPLDVPRVEVIQKTLFSAAVNIPLLGTKSIA